MESGEGSNRSGRASFGECMLKFIGGLICAIVLSIGFLGFALTSGLSFGGSDKVLLLVAELIFIVGVALAFVGLFDDGGGNQYDSAWQVTPTAWNETHSGTESYRARTGTRTEPTSDSDETTSELLTEPARILEAVDIQQFIKTASRQRIHLANADRATVSRFFNAIRYKQMDLVRKLLSDNPLLILTQDAYGNTPLEAAVQENYSELQSFFQACMN